MDYFKWEHSLAISYGDIDEQHQKLFNLVNEYFRNMSMGTAREVLAEVLDNLYLDMDIHFKTEERYFKESGYDELKGHVARHEYYLKRLGKLKDALHAGEDRLEDKSIGVLLWEFMKDYIEKHIKIDDVNFKNSVDNP